MLVGKESIICRFRRIYGSIIYHNIQTTRFIGSLISHANVFLYQIVSYSPNPIYTISLHLISLWVCYTSNTNKYEPSPSFPNKIKCLWGINIIVCTWFSMQNCLSAKCTFKYFDRFCLFHLNHCPYCLQVEIII